MALVYMGSEILYRELSILYPVAYRAFTYDSLSFKRSLELHFELFVDLEIHLVALVVDVGAIMVGAMLAFPRGGNSTQSSVPEQKPEVADL